MSRVLVILNLDRIDPARLISPRTLSSELNNVLARRCISGGRNEVKEEMDLCHDISISAIALIPLSMKTTM